MMGSMLRRGAISGDAALSLDFTAMSSTTDLTSLGFTFSRSTSGTYVNASGTVVTASANQARFNYSSGTAQGLLIEGAATNLLCHSTRLDDAQVGSEQYWVTTYSVTGSTNGITGPDGVANSATQFGPIAGNGTCIASAAIGTSAQRTFSFWAKRSSGSTNLEYTLDNGTNWVAVTTTSSWQRFTIAATTAAQRVGFRFAVNNVYEIWGCQLEAGAGATSTIVTAASTVTRAQDDCYISGSSFTSFYNSTAGSVFVEWVGGVYSSNINGRSFTLLNSAQSNQVFEGGGFGLNVYLSTFQAQVGNGLGSTGPACKLACAFAQDDFAVSVAGSAVATDTLGSMPTSVDRLSIGSNYLNSASFKFACIKQLRYWNTRLPNATLQSLST